MTQDEYGTSEIAICFYSIRTLIMIYMTQQDIYYISTTTVSLAKAVNGHNAGAVLRSPSTHSSIYLL
jgi:hypothetical protein